MAAMSEGNYRKGSRPKPASNALLEEYYSSQPGLFRDDADYEAFLSAMRKPLPATFWIHESSAFRDELEHELETTYAHDEGDAVEEDIA